MEQTQALEILLSGKNCLLTGPAGSGKTYLTKRFIEELHLQDKNVVIVAPTGIAALNIGGATVHSTFKMFGNYLHFKIPKPQSVVWNMIHALIVDEISMLGPDYLDYMDLSLKRFLRNDLPFGGIQVVLVGDPKQLPPVYGTFTEQDKADIEGLKKKYGTLTFESATSFKNFEVLTLEKMQRQTEPEFIELLNKLRDGNINAIMKFNQGKGTEHSVHLMPFNSMVDKFNDQQFAKIAGDSKKYTAKVNGKFNVKNCITPEVLELKPKCRVMVTKNLQCGLVNGDLGEVVLCTDDQVLIYSDRLEEDFHIEIEEWKEIQYDGVSETVIGSFKQIPLKLSWAMTIHKSQGLSLDDVCVHYVKGMSKELIYVGASRCKTFAKLFISM